MEQPQLNCLAETSEEVGLSEQSLPRISRRAFLGLAVTAAGASATYAIGIEPSRLAVRRVEVSIAGLPLALDGLKIGQLSDPHRCPFVPLARVERAVALLIAEKPDLIALTGDFVSYWSDYADEYPKLLSPLHPELGMFACLGNHDHWAGPDIITSALQSAGAIVLRNQHQIVSVNGTQLCIVGVDDIGKSGISVHRADPADDLPAALAKSPLSDVFRILLVHNPDMVMKSIFTEETITYPIHLVLSGHTHGGQVSLPLIGPPFLPSEYGLLFSGGLVEASGTHVYVSRGAGSSWPLRFNCPPEVNVLTLRSV